MKTIKLGNRVIPIVKLTEEEQASFARGCQLDGVPPVKKRENNSLNKDNENNN